MADCASIGGTIPNEGLNSRAPHSAHVSAALWFGAQGWLYKDWVGVFYPPGTTGVEMLAEYARVFTTVEVDSSYYATPPARTVTGWRNRTPEGFRFSLKTPSEITHVRRLRDADEPFAEFVDRVRLLGPKLAVVLVQCPPDFDPDDENRAALFRFMSTQLPRDVSIALEMRDSRWYDEALFALARRHGFALAVTEGLHSNLGLAGAIVDELIREPPAPFAYVRWLGDRQLTRFDRVVLDASRSLDVWERFVRALKGGVRDIYGYANNHYQGHSPSTVRTMLARLGEPVPPESSSPRLF